MVMELVLVDAARVQAADEIREAMDRFCREHAAWCADKTQTAILRGCALHDAVAMLFDVRSRVSFPPTFSDLSMRIGMLEIAYQDYLPRQAIGDAPLPMLLEKLHDVIAEWDSHKSARTVAFPNVRHALLVLKEHPLTIAKQCGCIENGKWRGPFFDERQRPREDLIHAEAENPGSVLVPGLKHPRQELAERQAAAKLMDVTSRASAATDDAQRRRQQERKPSKPKLIDPDAIEAAIVDYIGREGGTVGQAAKMFEMQVEEIEEICNKHAIRATKVVDIRADIAAENRRRRESANEQAETPSTQQEQSPLPETPGTPQKPQLDQAGIDAIVREAMAAGDDRERIAEILTEQLGYPVTPQKATSIMMRLRKEQPQATQSDDASQSDSTGDHEAA